MLLRSIVHMTLVLAASGAASGVVHAQALPATAATSAAAFTVGNIRVEGLQRISEG
ncbi:MAG: hypothetical protein RLZZ403_46, partial [Pseudomonadota bacterium]